MKNDLAIALSVMALVVVGGSVAGFAALGSGGSGHHSAPAVRQVDDQTTLTPISGAPLSTVARNAPTPARTRHAVVTRKPKRSATRTHHAAPAVTRSTNAKEPIVTEQRTHNVDPGQPAPTPPVTQRTADPTAPGVGLRGHGNTSPTSTEWNGYPDPTDSASS